MEIKKKFQPAPVSVRLQDIFLISQWICKNKCFSTHNDFKNMTHDDRDK